MIAMNKLLLALAFIVPVALTAPLVSGCATSTVATARLDAAKAWIAAESAADAAVVTADVMVNSGLLSIAADNAVSVAAGRIQEGLAVGRAAYAAGDAAALASAAASLNAAAATINATAQANPAAAAK